MPFGKLVSKKVIRPKLNNRTFYYGCEYLSMGPLEKNIVQKNKCILVICNYLDLMATHYGT